MPAIITFIIFQLLSISQIILILFIGDSSHSLINLNLFIFYKNNTSPKSTPNINTYFSSSPIIIATVPVLLFLLLVIGLASWECRPYFQPNYQIFCYFDIIFRLNFVNIVIAMPFLFILQGIKINNRRTGAKTS